MTALYANIQDGRIACRKHGGQYLDAAIKAHPRAHRWATPLGTWVAWDDADEAEWRDRVGVPAECDTCGAQHDGLAASVARHPAGGPR